jgi:hypothetical protein
MDKILEYIGEVLPDGQVSIPEEIRQTLAASPHAQIQITIKLLQSDEEQQQEAWEVFRRMGQDAQSGCLQDASIHHDRYLYGKKG